MAIKFLSQPGQRRIPVFADIGDDRSYVGGYIGITFAPRIDQRVEGRFKSGIGSRQTYGHQTCPAISRNF